MATSTLASISFAVLASKLFVKKLLELKPDFPKKGRVLIGHYIKFEEIVECVVEDLNEVGLIIE